MSSYHKGDDVGKRVTSTEDFVSASDGGRNVPMEYDDIKFINEDSPAADKDNHKVYADVQPQGLPRFNLDEHLKVQLRFDSPDEAHILLEDHSHRVEHWVSDFSRGDDGVLALEATSQNIEFTSSAPQTCTISRQINVWSEATSSESVQMLLNSVGQEEIKMITEENPIEGSDAHESLHSPRNEMVCNEAKSESSASKPGTVLEGECGTSQEKNQLGFVKSSMDVRDDNPQLSSLPDPSEGNRSEQGNSFSDKDSRPEDDKCVLTMRDATEGNKSELAISASLVNSLPDVDAREPVNSEGHRSIESGSESQLGVEQPLVEQFSGCIPEQEIGGSHSCTEMGDKRKGIMADCQRSTETVDNEGGQCTTATESSQKVDADRGETDFQRMSDPIMGESNEDKVGKHAKEASLENVLSSELQGHPASLLDDSNKESIGTCASWRVTVESNFKGRPESLVDEHEEDNTGRCPKEVPQESVVSTEPRGMLESLLDESNENIAGKSASRVLHEDAVPGEIREIPESILDEISGEKAQRNATEALKEVAVYAETQRMLDPLVGNSNKSGKHVIAKSVYQEDDAFGHKQEILNSTAGERCQDSSNKHVSDATHEDVPLVRMQGISNPLIDGGNKDSGWKQVEDVALASNDVEFKCKSEQRLSADESIATDLAVHENSPLNIANVSGKTEFSIEVQGEPQEERSALLESSEGDLLVDQKEKGLETEEKFNSGEDVIIPSNRELARLDANFEQDGSSNKRTKETDSDSQVKASEGVPASLRLGDSSSLPLSHGVAGSTDSAVPCGHEEAGQIFYISSDINLAAEMRSAPTMQAFDVEPQSVKSLVIDPISSQNDQNQNYSSATPTARLDHNVKSSSSVNDAKKCFEVCRDSTQNEFADVNETIKNKSPSPENSSLFVDVSQDQKNEREDVSVKWSQLPKDGEPASEVTASPCNDRYIEMKAEDPVSISMPLPSCTERETAEQRTEALSVEEPNGSPLSLDKTMTDTCQQELQVIEPSIITGSGHTEQTNLMSKEFEKCVEEGHTLVDAKIQEVKSTEAPLSSDKQKHILASDSGSISMQTTERVCQSDISESKGIEEAGKGEADVHTLSIALHEKEIEEAEKDKGKSEGMEVNLEVGISLEPDNDSPTIDRNVKHVEGDVLLPGDNKLSAEESDLVHEVEPPFRSSDVDGKVEKVETATEDLKGKLVSQSDDTFTFKVGTKSVPSGKSADASSDLSNSVLMDKNAGCWKPFQISQPSGEIQDIASTAIKTGEVQSKTFQENAINNGTRNAAVTEMHSTAQEEGNAGCSVVKAKPMPDGGKGGHTDTVKESDKKSTSHNPKSFESQTASLCTVAGVCSVPISSGNHPISMGARQEQKSTSAGPTDISTKFHSSTPVQTSTLPDLNATVVPASLLFQQPFTDSQQVQLRAQILVYGSLIQGSLPEESLMITAFADIGGASHNGTALSDGGRSVWENAWHIAADRVHRKGFLNSSEMPAHISGSSTPSAIPSKIAEGMKTPNPSAIVNVTDSRNSPVLGMRSADLGVSRSHSLQSRVAGTPNTGRVGSKNTPAAIMSPPRPVALSSPVWGMSTPVNEGMQGFNIPRSLHIDPHQMTAARHLYQSPPLGHYPPTGSTTPWLSHPSFPGPWITPNQGTLSESGLPFPTFAVPEVTQETPNSRRTSAPSCVPYTQTTPLAPPFSTVVGAATVHTSTNVNTDTLKGSMGVGRQSSSEQKTRKRKKSRVSEEIVQTGGLTPSGVQVTPVTSISTRPLSSMAVSSPGSSMVVSTNPAQEAYAGGNSSALFVAGTSTPNIPSVSHYQIISRGEVEQRVIFSEETSSRIEQAKLNAEDAASVAATAVKHSQAIWSQLAAQKNSGLVSDCEAKLASAAVAAAAAASVAKAAAAAAKVASDAAVQAKLMASEALNSGSKADAVHSSEVGLLEGSQRHCHSIIAAAREAAKKRVEAASAATKRAQNLDAVVRAAELAAQAVSQAGAVVAMGDPIPLTLSTLLEAGAEGYWKLVNQATSTQKHDNVQNETQPPEEMVTRVAEKSVKHLKSKDKKDVSKKETVRTAKEGMKAPATGLSDQVEKDCTQTSDSSHRASMPADKHLDARKDNQVFNAVQTAVSVSEAENGPREAVVAPEAEPVTESCKKAVFLKSNEIKEGSFVEVVSDEEGLRGVWFSAKVLSLKDGKAFVRYDELLSDEGPGQLRECIPLEGEHGQAPRIRMAHPMTVIKFEGTRKRRRAAMGNYVWSVGDRVDAWIRDGWWEGIVMGKSEDDESKLTVHFPGEGDTTIIKAWNLRPSLVWKDGQWVEWTNLKAQKDGAHEDDLPSEKRQKLDKHEIQGEGKGKEKLQKIPNLEEGKKVQELTAVMSSGKDKSFAVMRSTMDGGSSTGIKANQTGLQKEGSKVVSGVPKPTKKRKFMDVSKHYVSDRTGRISPEGKTSSKFDKALISHNHGGLRTTNRVEDRKPKKTMIFKSKELKSDKGQDGQSKTRKGKDKSSVANPTASKESLGHDLGLSGTLSIMIDGNSKMSRRNVLGGGHLPGAQKSDDAPYLSTAKESMARKASPSTKVKASSATESEQGSKGKQSSASDNSSLNVEKAASRQEVTKDKIPGKAATDNMEPRRSNRRIQPTSRLLEGLQSSPTAVKSLSSSFSHEKGVKAQSKASSTVPKGNVTG